MTIRAVLAVSFTLAASLASLPACSSSDDVLPPLTTGAGGTAGAAPQVPLAPLARVAVPEVPAMQAPQPAVATRPRGLATPVKPRRSAQAVSANGA